MGFFLFAFSCNMLFMLFIKAIFACKNITANMYLVRNG